MTTRYVSGNTNFSADVFCYAFDTPEGNALASTLVEKKTGVPLPVTGLSFSRTKANAAGTLNFSMAGQLPACIFVGNWLLLRSSTRPINEQNPGIYRFLGQIDSVSVNTLTAESGQIRTISSVSVREWSYILFTPVRYDAFSAARAVSETQNQAAAISLGLKTIGDSANNDIEQASKAYDPFKLVKLALAYVGAVSNSGARGVLENVVDPEFKAALDFSQVASRLPKIPREVLEAVGASSVTGADASSGLALVLSGIQTKQFPTAPIGAIQTLPSSQNVFVRDLGLEQGVADSFEIPRGRPVSSNITTILSSGNSAWGIVQAVSDSEINEVFTDLWYFRTVDGIEYARPVIVHRDRPFALRRYLDYYRASLGNTGLTNTQWTAYDDLPRTYVPEALIVSVGVRSDILSSPNYIRVGAPGFQSRETDFVNIQAQILSTKQLDPEMDRYGGIERYIQTSFSGVTTSTFEEATETAGVIKPASAPQSSAISWFGDLSTMIFLWESNRYRTGKGTLRLKDSDLRVMVGTNLTFNHLGSQFCCHVEGFSYGYEILPSGNIQSYINIDYSYLVRVLTDGSLDYLSPVLLANLALVRELPDLPSTAGSIEETLQTLANRVRVLQEARLRAQLRKATPPPRVTRIP